MRFSVLATVSALAAGAFAMPAQPEARNLAPCLDNYHAQRVAQNFGDSISAFTHALAARIFTSNLHDYSDSVIELINGGCPTGPATLGQPTFASLAAFQAGQGSQPNITFNILNVWHNCDTVFLRWEGPIPNPLSSAAQQPVRGIIVLETTHTWTGPEPYLINTVYSEFNSGAWMVDLGIVTPTCPAPAPPGKRDDANIFQRMPAHM